MILVDRNFLEEKGVPKVDYHIHTRFSDGTGNIEDYVSVAIRRNLREIAITEHVWKTSNWIPVYLLAIENASKKFNFPIHAGIEVKAININGEIDSREDAAKKMHIVMGAVHRYPSDKDYEFRNTAELTPNDAARIEMEALLSLIKNPLVNAIAHPTRSYYKFFPHSKQDFPIDYLREVARMAKKRGVAIEWSPRWGKNYILKLYLDVGVKILLGSDAHSPDDVGKIGRRRILKLLSGRKPYESD